jgi:hypothetical protein
MPGDQKESDFIEKILKIGPPPDGCGWRASIISPKFGKSITDAVENLKKTRIFIDGKLKAGSEGGSQPLSIPDIDRFCLDLLIEIALHQGSQDPAKERERIEAEYAQLEEAFSLFCLNLYYRQGHFPGKTALNNQKRIKGPVSIIREKMEKLKKFALDKVSDDPKGKACPDLRDSLAKVFKDHIPDITPLTIDARLNELNEDLDLKFPSGPGTIRKRIARRKSK